MAVDRGRRGGVIGGISLGGILVIVGIIVAIVWSLWLGIIIALIGLIAFGGRRSNRRTGSGIHQFQRPKTDASAGTSGVRMTVASSRRPAGAGEPADDGLVGGAGPVVLLAYAGGVVPRASRLAWNASTA